MSGVVKGDFLSEAEVGLCGGFIPKIEYISKKFDKSDGKR
jgi:hypothetical protein